VVVQLVGIVNSVGVMSQLAWANVMPRPIFLAVAAGVALTVRADLLAALFLLTPPAWHLQVAMSLARLSGRIPAQASGTEGGAHAPLGLWRKWQLLSGCAGIAVVTQVCCSGTAGAGCAGQLLLHGTAGAVRYHVPRVPHLPARALRPGSVCGLVCTAGRCALTWRACSHAADYAHAMLSCRPTAPTALA
jgi:hypothetical protein